MRKNFSILALFCIFCLTSCINRRYIYTGSPANNPYFKEKGESQLNVYYSMNSSFGYAHGFDLQAAYAISDHWALTAGYYNRSEKDEWDYTEVKYSRNLFDVGAGYFLPVDNKKKLFFNAYGGMAFGKYSMFDAGENFNNAIRKTYLQGSMNYLPFEYVGLFVVFKTSFVHYGNLQTTYPLDKQQLYSLDLLKDRTLTFFEPEINVRVGLPDYPWIKIEFVSSAAYLSGYKDARFDIREGNYSVGLSFDLTKFKKPSKEKQ